MPDKPHILVAAGLIWRSDGYVLISQRLPNDTHAGCWELPGGKIEAGETPAEAVVREIEEELGVHSEAGNEFARVTWEYPGKVVTLVGLHVRYLEGDPEAREVAQWRWVHPDEMLSYSFPEANTQLFSSDWRTPPKGWVR